MILMVIDHARDMYFGFSPNPMNLDETWPFLYVTRWVTHLCAPVFVFLAGASAYFYGSRRQPKDLQKFLLTRGLWLIFLEVFVVRFLWAFSLGPPFFMQVIWALGTSMILLALTAWMQPKGVLLLGIAIVCSHNALQSLDVGGVFWQVMMAKARWQFEGHTFLHGYAVIPWFGVMAIGYGFGYFYRKSAEQERELLCQVSGVFMILSFVILRTLNLYGDPNQWRQSGDAGFTIMSFFKVEKYPPSLQYVLITLGIALTVLPLLRFVRNRSFGWVLLVFGRVPLFFYLGHLFVLRLGVATLQPANIHSFGIGATLLEAWGVSLLTVLILLPLCQAYGAYKRTRNYWWLSYL